MSNEIRMFEHKQVGFGEELLKDHFVEARFTNSDRTWIEVITNEKGDTLTSTHIEYDENQPYYQALMTVTNIDKIHEWTYNHNERQRKEFEAFALQVAKDEGLVQTDQQNPTKVLDLLFNEEEATEDEMFALKIAVFEIPKIKDSKNLDAKKALRKSKTRLELIKGAIDLYSAE